ncbi:C1-like protein [Tanacetum coccineum]
MEEINHFSHEKHPLQLINGETIISGGFKGGDNEEKLEAVGCFACVKPISPSDSAYGCTQCRFFLHKSCAQLPLTINLPSIYHHPLTLTNFKSFSCELCRLEGLTHGLCYTHIGVFGICINCYAVESARKLEADAIKEEAMVKLKHKGHPHHNLTLLFRPGAILCDACKTEERDLFYLCDSCDFLIHKTCTSLAPTLDLPHHPTHPLVLVYSLPEKFYNYAYFCEFCKIFIRRNEWLYHCANCRYFAHIKCALNAPPPSTPRDRPSTSGANEDSNSLLHFPMSDVFTDPLKLLHLDNLSLDDNDKLEIMHQSHRHPLTLNVEPQHNNMPSTSDSIEACNFQLDLYCATRTPQSFAHRYCKGDEALLTYPPVENHPEDFYCDTCESLPTHVQVDKEHGYADLRMLKTEVLQPSYTTTVAAIPDDILVPSSGTCRGGLFFPMTCHRQDHVGEGSKGIESLAIFPGDITGTTTFSVNKTVGS